LQWKGANIERAKDRYEKGLGCKGIRVFGSCFLFFFSVLVSRAEKQEPKVTDAFTGLSITLKTTSPQKSAIMLQALVAEK